MFCYRPQICLITVILVATSFAILGVSAEVERLAHDSTEIDGETDAEELGELTILDVLLRKRRETCDKNVDEKLDEVLYQKVDEIPTAGNETEISVEQAEIVSYEEIIRGVEVQTNPSPVADFLTPPAEDANCTSFTSDPEDPEIASDENTEKELVVDTASGTVLAYK